MKIKTGNDTWWLVGAGLIMLAVLILNSGRELPGPASRFGRSSHSAPLDRQPPYKLSGSLGAIWAGDTIELVTEKGSHCIRMIGVDCPERSQDQFRQARSMVSKLLRKHPVQIDVIRFDESLVEISQVRTGETDVGLELIRAGLAWFISDEFPDNELYQQAEIEAREMRIGIWASDAPVPPWEVWEKEQPALNQAR